jgi:membrane-bound serine protease (ClpP class)
VLIAIAVLLTLFVLSPRLGVVVIALAAIFEIAEFLFWRRFLRRYRIRTGAEAMVGASAEVVQALDPEGRVRFRGALWNARADTPIKVGEAARVTAVDGLTLEVSPAEDSEAPPR